MKFKRGFGMLGRNYYLIRDKAVEVLSTSEKLMQIAGVEEQIPLFLFSSVGLATFVSSWSCLVVTDLQEYFTIEAYWNTSEDLSRLTDFPELKFEPNISVSLFRSDPQVIEQILELLPTLNYYSYLQDRGGGLDGCDNSIDTFCFQKNFSLSWWGSGDKDYSTVNKYFEAWLSQLVTKIELQF